jgi:uncharacterized membrane protein
MKPDAASAMLSAGVTPLSLDALLGAGAYVTLVPAVAMLLIPQARSKRFVCFHACQSLAFTLATLVIAVATKLGFAILSVFPFLGFLLAWLLAGLVGLAIFFVWVLLIVKAALGEAYELPWIGQFVLRACSRK